MGINSSTFQRFSMLPICLTLKLQPNLTYPDINIEVAFFSTVKKQLNCSISDNRLDNCMIFSAREYHWNCLQHRHVRFELDQLQRTLDGLFELLLLIIWVSIAVSCWKNPRSFSLSPVYLKTGSYPISETFWGDFFSARRWKVSKITARVVRNDRKFHYACSS
jgi:hypothetical protein